MEELPDGGLRLSFPVADYREVKMIVLGFGADVEVLEPEGLRAEVAREIRKMVSVCEGDGGG